MDPLLSMDLLSRLLAALDEGMRCRALAASRRDAENDLSGTGGPLRAGSCGAGTGSAVLSDQTKKSRNFPYPGINQAEQSWRHSLRAAARRSLNAGLDERCRSWLNRRSAKRIGCEPSREPRRISAKFAPRTSGSHPAKAKHRPLPSSEWLVGILNAVVDPAAGFALVDTLATKAFSR